MQVKIEPKTAGGEELKVIMIYFFIKLFFNFIISDFSKNTNRK
jgi:hypothetical protein